MEEAAAKQKVKDKPAKAIVSELKKPFQFKQEKELQEIEAAIASLEQKISVLNLIMIDGSTKPEDLIFTSVSINSYQKDLNSYLDQWLILTALKEANNVSRETY